MILFFKLTIFYLVVVIGVFEGIGRLFVCEVIMLLFVSIWNNCNGVYMN